MTKKVLKFGGTSVGSIERIVHAAKIVKKEQTKVVISPSNLNEFLGIKNICFRSEKHLKHTIL